MPNIIEAAIPVEEKVAVKLRDQQQREAVGRMLSRMLDPDSGVDHLMAAIERLKADAQAREVSVSTAGSSTHAEVRIGDTGPGIAAADLKMYDRFSHDYLPVFAYEKKIRQLVTTNACVTMEARMLRACRKARP